MEHIQIIIRTGVSLGEVPQKRTTVNKLDIYFGFKSIQIDLFLLSIVHNISSIDHELIIFNDALASLTD